MGFANNAYAKVWEVRENRIRISTSYRKEDGQFADDFNAWTELLGKAKDIPVAEGDRIRLRNVSVSNSYNKEAQKENTYYKIFNFEKAD